MKKRLLGRIKFLFTVHRSIPFLFDFYKSKEIKLRVKAIFSVLILGYVLIPIDMIPDFITVFGVVDDITMVIILLQLMVKVAPDSLQEKYKKIA